MIFTGRTFPDQNSFVSFFARAIASFLVSEHYQSLTHPRETRLPVVLNPGHDLGHPSPCLFRIIRHPLRQLAVLFISASLNLFFLGTNSTHHNFACPPLFECLINIPGECPISSQPTSTSIHAPDLANQKLSVKLSVEVSVIGREISGD